jgi:hypothetical protein
MDGAERCILVNWMPFAYQWCAGSQGIRFYPDNNGIDGISPTPRDLIGLSCTRHRFLVINTLVYPEPKLGGFDTLFHQRSYDIVS